MADEAVRAWIRVASADHVARGKAGGFMQVGHGKGAPLRRLRPGDEVAYYAPTRTYGGFEPCRAFVAVGRVADGEPYRVEMEGGFHPWRRDVVWAEAREVPVATLKDRLAFTSDRNWGYGLRLGLVGITLGDMALIAAAMGADLGPAQG